MAKRLHRVKSRKIDIWRKFDGIGKTPALDFVKKPVGFAAIHGDIVCAFTPEELYVPTTIPTHLLFRIWFEHPWRFGDIGEVDFIGNMWSYAHWIITDADLDQWALVDRGMRLYSWNNWKGRRSLRLSQLDRQKLRDKIDAI